MDSIDTNAAVVQALVRARRGGPPADDRAFQAQVTTARQAYAIQHGVLQALGDPPGLPRHWKSGAPSRAATLLHSPLPAAGVRGCGAGVADLGLRHRWIEAEIALRIAREVTPQEALQLQEPEQAAALVEAMCVAIEAVDSRWASARDAAPLLKLADFLVHGALVLGDFVAFSARPWADQACRVRVADAEWQTFNGSLGVGDPCWVLPAWLRHATREGASVPAGTIVTTGTWCGLLQAQAGDRVQAEFPGVGSVQVQL